jgi:hypothetical protein
VNVKIYSERIQEAAVRNRFTLSWYGTIDDIALPVLQRRAGDSAPEVFLSTGVHGNEPAGPMAVLDMLRRGAFPDSLNLTLFPLVNPTGLIAGTRENRDGIDLNRDYGLRPATYETRSQLEWIGNRTYDLVLCLHEDDDGEGFYLYSHIDADTPHDYAELALEAARPWTGIDPRECIDDMPAKDGRMMPPDDVFDINGTELPEALRLHFHHGARFTFTTETPSRQPIDKRIRAQCAVMEAIFEAYLKETGLDGSLH